MKKREIENLHFIELVAHEITFDGVKPPIDIGQGVTLRSTNAEETQAISEYLTLSVRSTCRYEENYLCIDAHYGSKGKVQFPVRMRYAFALLPEEIIFRSEFIQMRRIDGKMVVGMRGSHGRGLGANILESHNFLIGKNVKLNQECIDRISLLMTYPLDDDPFMKSFEAAHDSLPNSEFRFVTYMSIIEGLIATKDIGRTGDNISTKMDYFYNYIWPTLNLAKGLPQPEFRKGQQIEDLRGAWSDLYKIRNLVAHGGGNSLVWGKPLKETVDKLSALRDSSRGEAVDLLEYGVKSLLYWHLERPAERETFSKII